MSDPRAAGGGRLVVRHERNRQWAAGNRQGEKR
jgi:hypothetical protein